MAGQDSPPPPYSATPSTGENPSHAALEPRHQGADANSIFNSHLSSLRGQILSEQASRSSIREQQDYETLSLLVPEVEALIGSVASIHPPPALVEGILVPYDAIGEGWQLSDLDAKQDDCVTRVILVKRAAKMNGDKKPSPLPKPTNSDRRFDGWGGWEDRDTATASHQETNLWWSDEEMAHRLARHLQPKRAPPSVDKKAFPAQPLQKSAAKKSERWSFFRADKPRTTEPSSSTASPSPPDDVAMSVKTEETTFRRQNQMGLWESKRGWGLVVVVNIRKT